MSHRDILANRAARPSTPVPGHWLLDLPTLTAKLHIRRYQDHSSQPSFGNGKTVLEGLRTAPLEKAWREINASGDGDARGLLGGWCCTTTTESDVGELWCFVVRDDAEDIPLLVVNGLDEMLPRKTPIDLAQLVTCSQHGHDLLCLRVRKGHACDVLYEPSTLVIGQWEVFTDAVVEKLAWRARRRLVMRPGPFAISPRLSMQVSLRPLPSSQLLLVVQTQGSLGCRPVDPGVTLPRHLRPLLLRPLGLPALLLGPYTTTQPQDSQLSLNFEAALGSAWVGGRSERRLKIQLLDETFTDWSVYWVPLPDGQLEIQTLSPAQVALAWQQRQGVVTIWPTHLSHDLTLGSSVLKSKRRTPPILTDLPTTEDLMDVASSIFDLYSSQRDPPATVTPEAEEVSGLHADTSEQVRNPQSAVDGKKSDPHKSQEGSDIDDLFSAASDSPSPPIPLEPVEPEQWDINELFDPSNDDGHVYLGDDVVMASPSRQMDTIADADNAEQVEVTDNNLVTEDDFNFFDSPAAADNALQPASEEVLPHEIMSVRAPDPAETTARPTDGSIGNDDTEIEPSAETQHHRSPTPALSTPPPAQKRKREQPPSSLKSNISLKRQAHDLIPISFNPISLVSAPVFPAFPYDPPTPAPTPETLRPELVDRLRGSKKAKYDYTAAWTMESDSSEVDEDEDQTYVPPTPVSEADTEDLQSTKHPPTPHEGSGSLADFEYGGGTCIGAEWLRLKDTPEVAKIMSRPWNAAWVEGGYGSSCSAVAKTALRPDNHRLDLLSLVQSDRFACEVLANRHFRALFITTLEHSTASERPTEEPLLWEGVTLGNLVDSDDDIPKLQPLSPCSIHAGYMQKVLRLSIAGLRYWCELGLQPVGGQKNISALIVCEVGDGMKRAAALFLARMAEVYHRCRLGSHNIGAATRATRGVISIPVAGFADTVASLTNQRIGDTVVYVLLPSSASQLVLRRLLSLVPPAMETCFVHLTPLSALHPRQLEALAFEVYDRMPRLVKRVEVRGLPMDEAPVHLQYPSFTLAPDGPPKPAFTLAWPLRSYDVLNKWRLAHCAYGYDARTEMLVAFAIDAEGEEWRVKTWRDISGPRLMECIEGLWEFFTVFATTAAIEWRLTLSRLGAMSWDEYDGSVLLLTRREGEPDENIAWRTLIATKNAAVTILTVDPPLPLGLSHTHTRPTGPHITPAILADPSMRIVDESLLAHIAIFPYRNSVNLATSALEPTGPTTIYAMTSFLFSIATNGGYSSYVNHVLTHRSAPGKEDENVEQLLGREWYRLSCLGRMRFGFDGALPVHLEGVRIALECFDGIVGNDWH